MLICNNMKKIFLLILTAVALISSCHKPEYVPPTVERQGITSLTAFFTSTSEQFEDKELAKLTVTDPDADRYVIPIPYYFPEESTNPTTLHMTRVRVKAELAPNCKIYPPLQILDLTQENEFTFTNAQGESRKIIITGSRNKSNKCNLVTFSLTNPYPVEGFINEETKEIYIFTVDDLSSFSASATACAHATVETNLVSKKNYNNEQSVTVVAQDGKTKCTYKILKKHPTKIPFGFREKSVRRLFNMDAISRLNFPAYSDEHIFPSLGYIGGHLVVSMGNGSAPIYIDALTGVKLGSIEVGDAPADAITSDEGGNLLLTNHAAPTEVLNIYRTKSVSQAPEFFHSFTNETDVAVGYHVKVHGNIDTDAVITLTHEGIEGVTGTSKYTRVIVSGGQVVATETIDLSPLGIGWANPPGHCAKVVSVSSDIEKGIMVSYYTPYSGSDIRNSLKYVDGNGSIAATLPIFEIGSDAQSNYNSNVMDAKTFNNATYAVHLVTSWFANWYCGPQLRVFDISSPSSIKNGNTVLMDQDIQIDAPGSYDSGYSSGDVIMAPSADGFKVYVFYFDHNSAVIGGYVADCIDI
ncbi:MAG: DUF5018 domain-containing protein [Bacteroidales bacterium]|nr:DUF5018 domain-containing protein [Bacteroidales bacterium]